MSEKHNISRREFIKQTSFAVAGSVALAACGGTGGANTNTSNKVVIWSPGDSGPIKDWKTDPILKEVERVTNTQIEIVNIGWDSYTNKLNAAVASRKIPDIIACYDSGAQRTIKQWVRNKVVAPFEGELATAAPNIVKQYDNNDSIAELKIEGKIYSQPVYWGQKNGPNAQAVYVRKDLIDKYGLKVPDTFEEYITYVKQLKEKGLKGIVLGGKVAPGGSFVDPVDTFLGAQGLPKYGWVKREGQYKFWAVQPEVEQAYLLFRRFYQEKLITEESWELDTQHAQERFQTGQYASYIGLSGGHTGRMQNAFDSQKKGYQAWVLPALDAGKGKRGYTSGPQFWGVTMLGNLSGNNPIAAARVLNYLNSPEGLKLTALGIKGKDYEGEGDAIKFLPQRSKDNFPEGSVGDTGAHPLATPIVSWVPIEWQEFALLYGRGQEYKEWYKKMQDNIWKYTIPAYGSISSTPLWLEFSPVSGELMAKTFLPMVKAKTDQEASKLFKDFVTKWHAQGGEKASKEMSDYLLTIYS